MHLQKREEQWLLNEKYQGIANSEFFTDLEKLQQGTPLGYLIGHIPFMGCTIALDSKPLIPRPETEYWVHWVITHAIQNKSYKVLDIFAGSGCIGIAILKHTTCQVDFGELHPQHAMQIESNLKINAIQQERYKVYQSNMFEDIPQEQQYDIIVANPPYISKDRVETVEASVLNYEDHSALFADNNGLEYIAQLIQQAVLYLKKAGTLYFEFDPWQQPLIVKLCISEGITNYTFLEDQYNKQRICIIKYT